VNERKVTAKLYLKSRLNHILLRSEFDPTKVYLSQPEDKNKSEDKNESGCVEVIKVEKEDEEMNSEGDDSDIEIIEDESENENEQDDSDNSEEDRIDPKRRKISNPLK